MDLVLFCEVTALDKLYYGTNWLLVPLPEMVKCPQLVEHSIRGLKNPTIFDSFFINYVTRAPYKLSGRRVERGGGQKN